MRVNVQRSLGLEIGLNLAVSQVAAHHGIDAPLVACDVALAHCIYGRDRMLDDIANLDAKHPSWDARIPFISTTIAWVCSSMYLIAMSRELAVPIESILVLCYPQLKKRLHTLKPLFIGVVWAYAIVCLPADADTFECPMFMFNACLYASASNLVDIEDTNDDRRNGIWTIPSLYGTQCASTVSGLLAVLAMVAHARIIDRTWGDIYNDVAVICCMCWSALRCVKTTESHDTVLLCDGDQNADNRDGLL